MTPQETKRVAELIEQAGVSIEAKLRSIYKEMPHLTDADIQQVASVRAEELKLDAAVQLADAEASKRMAEIIREAGRISGQPLNNLEKAIPVLVALAEQGDERATSLLEEFRKAAPIVGLSD